MIGGKHAVTRGVVSVLKKTTDTVKIVRDYIALCLICRNEPIDRIINTIEYYKALGFNKILFYDGNEDDYIYIALRNYINRGYIIYHKCNNIKDYAKQSVFKLCYDTYNKHFEWIAFLDVDEHLILNKHDNIVEYLSQSKFNNSNIIQIDRKTIIKTGGNVIAEYDNSTVKCIVHCNYPYVVDIKYKYITNILCGQKKDVHVNGNGNVVKKNGKTNKRYDEAYIEHIHSTSFNDFLMKLKNGKPTENRFNILCLSYIEMKLRGYFKHVEFTNEHLNQINSIFPDFDITKESIFNEKNLSIKTDIDYVFPYVDDTDEEWYNEYKKHKGDVDYENDTVAGAARYKTYGLLKYKLRSIEQNMPWVRNIYMIVSSKSQVPKWLNTTKIKIVYHKDIIPEEFLPTFNSSTIEMFLGNIEGLSEKFLYGNDDLYVLKPMMPYVFFRNNKPLLHLIERSTNNKGKLGINYITDAFIKNDIDIAKTGTKYKDIEKLFQPDHNIKPMLKSKIKEVVDNNKEVIYSGCTRFRDFNNFNQYLYHYYNVFNDNYISYNRKTASFAYKGMYEKLLNMIDTYSLISIDFDLIVDNHKIIDDIFHNKFPIKCKYEKI